MIVHSTLIVKLDGSEGPDITISMILSVSSPSGIVHMAIHAVFSRHSLYFGNDVITRVKSLAKDRRTKNQAYFGIISRSELAYTLFAQFSQIMYEAATYSLLVSSGFSRFTRQIYNTVIGYGPVWLYTFPYWLRWHKSTSKRQIIGVFLPT